jgi:hypothetical protein|tara:strand:+ start:8675 stop:9160 length:486 start_codon:yes stop_codon:yes gene_type:complete
MGINKNYYGVEFFPDMKSSGTNNYVSEKTFKKRSKIKPTLKFKKIEHTVQGGNLGEPKKEYGVSVSKDNVGIYFKKKFKSGGLNKWFKEKWVDVGAPKKNGKYQPCGRKSASGSKRKYPKCVPLAKATRMTKSQKASAVSRKRAAGNPPGKPTNVKTFAKA